MLETIFINGVPFCYEKEDITYDNNSPISEDDARQLLVVTNNLFSEIGLRFYLAYGTLLGAVRDKGLIKGDEDVDVFIDDETTLYENLPFLYEKGLKLVRMIKGRMYTFRINETSYIDVYILRPLHNSIWSFYCYALSTLATPKKYFSSYQTIDLLGVTCYCPKDPEGILEFWYGKSWRTPSKGHKFYYEVKSAYYFHHFKPICLNLIKWPNWRHLILKKYKTKEDSLKAWKYYY